MITTNPPAEGPRTRLWATLLSWVHVIAAASASLWTYLLHVCLVLPTLRRPSPSVLQGLSGKEQSATTATVSTIQGDITELAVDVIVNAANEKMSHDEGLAGYIVRKGGNKIQEECYRILRTRGKLSEGDVLMSRAGKLPCKSIIHAVGPVYRGGTRGEKECLRGTVLKCLKTASDLGYTSIALPAISSGVLRYPVEEATRVIVQAVMFFLDTNPESSIKDVRLCDISRKTVQDFKGAIQAALAERDLSAAPSSRATSQAGAGSSHAQRFSVSRRMTQPTNEKKILQKKGFDKSIRKPKIPSLPETLKLYIFTANPQKRADFLKALDELVDRKFVEQEIEDFDKVSPDMLKDACKKYDVELLLWDKGAIVGGILEDVQMLKEEISSMIKKAEIQQHESTIANLVQWYYFDATGIPSKRVPYAKRENLQIENAYQMNKDTVKLTDSKGSVYVINLKDMTSTVEFNLAIPVKIMRKERSEDSACPLPETWAPLGNESVKRVPLVAGCPEYNNVMANIYQTANSIFRIISIERIQNADMYKQYVVKKAQIDRQNNGMSSEKILWHGTSSNAIDNINLYGFSRSFCGKNATAYGQGVYFAVNASYSMSDTFSVRDQSGRKHMYQCKVLVGYPTVGNRDMRFLPTRQGNVRYDSATDSESDPSQYVIFTLST